MFYTTCPQMYTPNIVNQLQHLRNESIIQPVIEATELILYYLFQHHINLYDKLHICIREENMVDISYQHGDINVFILVDPEEVSIDRCTCGHNYEGYHFEEIISINDIDELFIKKFQYIIYNANISNQNL